MCVWGYRWLWGCILQFLLTAEVGDIVIDDWSRGLRLLRLQYFFLRCCNLRLLCHQLIDVTRYKALLLLWCVRKGISEDKHMFIQFFIWLFILLWTEKLWFEF